MTLPYRKGSHGPEILDWQNWAYRAYAAYAGLIGAKDSYYGNGEAAFTTEMQRHLGIPQTGVFDAQTASRVGYKTKQQPRRKIWIYTSPGSGANFDQGPSFNLGNRCRDELNLNHQPVYFQKGGYLGLLGGAADFSYNEVIWDQYKSMEWLLDNNPDAQEAMRLAYAYIASKGWREADLTDAQLVEVAAQLEFEHHDSGYSQSAQGVEEACEMLYGDGGFVHPGDPDQTPSAPGKYRLIRHTLKLVVQFGNPSTKDTGIARKVRSPWLAAKIRNVNYDNDFYAVVPLSDKIRPAMYAIIVEADMSLPFFVHVLKIAGPIILQTIPIFGGFLGPLAPLALAGVTGLNAFLPLLTGLTGQAQTAGDEQVDRNLVEMLSVTGLIKNIPGLIGLVAALPGLQAHGGYEFDPAMMERAYQQIAGFRR